MFASTHSNRSQKMTDGLTKLEQHYEKQYPGTEICIMFKKGVYYIFSAGKIKESLTKAQIKNITDVVLSAI